MNDYQISLITQAEAAPKKRIFIRSTLRHEAEAAQDMEIDGYMVRGESTPRGTFYSATQLGLVEAGLAKATLETMFEREHVEQQNRLKSLEERAKWNFRRKNKKGAADES